MALITKRGREIFSDMNKAGMDLWSYQDPEQVTDALIAVSLIARHAKTYRRLQEIQCGDGVHSGEWVNKHWDWIIKRESQVEHRLMSLAKDLPSNVTLVLEGDPRGYVMVFIVRDSDGVPRMVGVE